MLTPSDNELTQARQLGIDPGRMNGPQLREAIARAERRKRAIENPESMRSEEFRYISRIAKSLGMAIIARENVKALKARIEKKLQEIYSAKGIKAGVTIQYGSGSRDHAGKKAQVQKVDVIWVQNTPHILLKMGGAKQAYTYHAHVVALHAEVVTS